MENVIECVCRSKVITIVRDMSPEYMLDLAKSLYSGGIEMIEVTFNQARSETWQDTVAAIRDINTHLNGKMLAGAGTVLTQEQLAMAFEAGAKYIITPNVDVSIIHRTKELGLCAFPGAMTPTEIVMAYNAGADVVKVFPASNLGPAYIKALKSPLSHIPLMAVGGINEKNVADFLHAGCIGVGVGGNLVNKTWIEAGDWDRITMLAREYIKAAQIDE
jgi:2-dehydro-3-deoxyphosphogluconate aldolase/(4S)-4-hydroxy-2-oxoglutarate aldolase